MSNKLKNEASPYLLQHAENPVDWYSWCEEAFQKAKSEDKPIFLSIGYSTCHWCHVMAHESFEDNKTAEILNRDFISIKVDREERPDIDSVYMSVCQAFTGSGGWPMSIFMTWDKKPFYAGTYFPVNSRYGMPGFCDLLNVISNQWKTNRKELMESAEKVIGYLKESYPEHNRTDSKEITEKAVQAFERIYDRENGGFGSAPKFPTPHNLLFLLYYSRLNDNSADLEMAEKTLRQMRMGGIFDHIGYGFSRYSTDKYYLAPHFEKMLYDNALLIMAYSAAFIVTENKLYLDTAEKCAEFILREMTSAEGGFYSAQDADSEGVEGKYYTFTLDEVIKVLGEERGKEFADAFDITEGGNFEGMNIPNLLKSGNITENFEKEKKVLYNYRKERTTLHTDHKIMTAWNSMMIMAMSMLYRITGEKNYLKSALKAQEFIEKNLCDKTQLYTSYCDGKRTTQGFLDDYAYYTAALTELYNSTLDRKYLEKAERFCIEAVKRFSDSKNGGFFLCEAKNSELFMNPKETYDGAIPSGNSVMMYNFTRLYQLTDKGEYDGLAEKQMLFMTSAAQDYPVNHSMFLLAKLMYVNPPKRIIVVPKEKNDIERIRDKLPFLANIVLLDGETEEYTLLNDRTTYYVCDNHACMPPTNDIPV